MFQAKREQLPRVAARIDKEALRLAALRYLPQLACQLAVLRDSPGRLTSDAILHEFLEELTDLIIQHLPAELREQALRQLQALCARTSSSHATLDACIRNIQERVETKLNIMALGGDTDLRTRMTLKSVYDLSADGGHVQKLAAESLWLSCAIEIATSGGSLTRENLSQRADLTGLSDEVFHRIKAQAHAIVTARSQAGREPSLSMPSHNRRSRHPLSSDVRRTLILAALDRSLPAATRYAALKRLGGDPHDDTIECLYAALSSPSMAAEEREIATCVLEDMFDDLSQSQRERIAAKAAQGIVHELGRSGNGLGLLLLLRLLAACETHTALSIERIFDDASFSRALRGTEHEVPVVLLFMTLVERSRGQAAWLGRMARGEELSHLSSPNLECIQRKAVATLATIPGGEETLVELLIEAAHARSDEWLPDEIADALARISSDRKSHHVLMVLKEALAEGIDGDNRDHIARLVRALTGTRESGALATLAKLLTDPVIPMSIRKECGSALRQPGDAELVELDHFIDRASVEDRICVLPALGGVESAQKLALLGRMLLKPIDLQDGRLAIKEKREVVARLREWAVL